MHPTGIITASERNLLHRAADVLGTLHGSDCAALAAAWQGLSCAQVLHPRALAEAIALADRVHQALLADTAPDRWLPDVTAMGVPLGEAMDVVAPLIQERLVQARLVADARAACATVIDRLPLGATTAHP